MSALALSYSGQRHSRVLAGLALAASALLAGCSSLRAPVPSPGAAPPIATVPAPAAERAARPAPTTQPPTVPSVQAAPAAPVAPETPIAPAITPPIAPPSASTITPPTEPPKAPLAEAPDEPETESPAEAAIALPAAPPIASPVAPGNALPFPSPFRPSLPPPTEIVRPSPSQAAEPKAYRKDAARHLYASNQHRIYAGKLPPLLYAIGVLDVEVDGRGEVQALNWQRAPRHAPEVIAEIERTVRAAAPYPAPTRMGGVVYTDVWLWDKSGRFQLDTLSEGQY